MPKLYNLHVALGLHWYQPYTQKPEILKKIAEESYIPILNSIERNCLGTINCDIAASLIFQLASGAPEVLERFRKLKDHGKIFSKYRGLSSDPAARAFRIRKKAA